MLGALTQVAQALTGWAENKALGSPYQQPPRNGANLGLHLLQVTDASEWAPRKVFILSPKDRRRLSPTFHPLQHPSGCFPTYVGHVKHKFVWRHCLGSSSCPALSKLWRSQSFCLCTEMFFASLCFEFEVARNAVSSALQPAGLPRESHFHCQNSVLQTQLPLFQIHSFTLLLSWQKLCTDLPV